MPVCLMCERNKADKCFYTQKHFRKTTQRYHFYRQKICNTCKSRQWRRKDYRIDFVLPKTNRTMYKCTRQFQTTNGVYYFLHETISEFTYGRLTPTEKNNFMLVPREWDSKQNEPIFVDDIRVDDTPSQLTDFTSPAPDPAPDLGGGGEFGGGGSSDSY